MSPAEPPRSADGHDLWVPDLLMGSTWTRIGNRTTDKGRFEYAQNGWVGTGPVEGQDRYGSPVPVVPYYEDWSVRSDDGETFAAASNATIEAASGAWVIYGEVTYYDNQTHPTGDEFGLFSYDCPSQVNARVPQWALERVDHRVGHPWDRTLDVGDHWTDHVVRNSIFGDVDETWDFTVAGKERIPAGWLDGRPVDAVRIDSTQRTVVADPAVPGRSLYERVLTSRDWYTTGVFLPIRSQSTVTLGSQRIETRSELTTFHSGDRPLPNDPTLPRAQFDGRHPTAAFATVDFVPDTIGLHLDFPLEDFISLLGRDPRSAHFAPWRALHPEAFGWASIYDPQREEGIYTWTALFKDGLEVVSTQGERRIVAENVAVDQVTRYDWIAEFPEPGRFWPNASDVRSTEVTTASLAGDVALPTMQESDDGLRFGWSWRLLPPVPNAGAKTPQLVYWFAPMDYAFEGGAGPAHTGYKAIALDERMVDATVGGLLPEGQPTIKCASGIFLSPP